MTAVGISWISVIDKAIKSEYGRRFKHFSLNEQIEIVSFLTQNLNSAINVIKEIRTNKIKRYE